jgi:hypothetical protein
MSLTKPFRSIQLNRGHPLVRGLKSCWLMNEGTGGMVNDLGRRKTGLVTDGQWKSGRFGSSLEFNGSSSKINAGNINLLSGANQFTIMYWAMPNVDLQEEAAAHFGGLAESYVFSMDWQGWTDGIGLDFYNTSGTRIFITTYDTYLLANQWYHITGLYDGLRLKIYIDAELVDVWYVGAHIVRDYPSSNFTIGGGWVGYFNGIIDNVAIWDRALSESELRMLYREPFVMFNDGVRSKPLYVPVTIISLEGSAIAQSSAGGKLSVSCKSSELEKFWLHDSLFNGMTANAIKLGTILSSGWFWMRNTGCFALYRGTENNGVDFSNILTVVEPNVAQITPPDYLSHKNNSTYFYVLRRFNNCGYKERTLNAAVKMSLDCNGDVKEPVPNAVLKINAEKIENGKVRLLWFYCPLEQKSPPERFEIYYDNRTGQVDYENPIDVIKYQGRKFYEFISASLEEGEYLFAVKVMDENDLEDNSMEQIKIQVATVAPEAVEIINVENI